MKTRLDDLTDTLTDLIGVRDRVKTRRIDLTDEDREAILPYLADAISDCEYLMRKAHDDLGEAG
jgi:hypothetical protein